MYVYMCVCVYLCVCMYVRMCARVYETNLFAWPLTPSNVEFVAVQVAPKPVTGTELSCSASFFWQAVDTGLWRRSDEDKLYMDAVAVIADIVVGQGAAILFRGVDPKVASDQANPLRASWYACDALEHRPDVAERGRSPDIQREVLPVLVARHVKADHGSPPRPAPVPLPLPLPWLGYAALAGASRGQRHVAVAVAGMEASNTQPAKQRANSQQNMASKHSQQEAARRNSDQATANNKQKRRPMAMRGQQAEPRLRHFMSQ